MDQQASKLPPASQEQWAEFINSSIWQDLLELFEDSIEVNRDLMEGITQANEDIEESLEALRGRNRELRRIKSIIQGWADGAIPIIDESQYVQRLNKEENDNG